MHDPAPFRTKRRIVLSLIALAGTVATPLAARPHVEAHVRIGAPPAWGGATGWHAGPPPAWHPGGPGRPGWAPPVAGRGWEDVSRTVPPHAFRDPRFVSWVLWNFDRNRDGRLSRGEGREAARVLWAQARPDPRWGPGPHWRDTRHAAPWETPSDRHGGRRGW